MRKCSGMASQCSAPSKRPNTDAKNGNVKADDPCREAVVAKRSPHGLPLKLFAASEQQQLKHAHQRRERDACDQEWRRGERLRMCVRCHAVLR